MRPIFAEQKSLSKRASRRLQRIVNRLEKERFPARLHGLITFIGSRIQIYFRKVKFASSSGNGLSLFSAFRTGHVGGVLGLLFGLSITLSAGNPAHAAGNPAHAAAPDADAETQQQETLKKNDPGSTEKPPGVRNEPEISEEIIPPEAPPPTDDILKPDSPEELERSLGESAKDEQPDLKKMREAERRRWKKIVVVPRKKVLKRRRVEIAPFIGTTINDTLIQHAVFGGRLNYYLTDVLAVGAQGGVYLDRILDDEFNTRYHFGRIPSLNRFRYSAAGVFTYVPIHGKFSLLNRRIAHFEVWINGGMGVTGTEIIPRELKNESFTNTSITFPIGIGARFFINHWMTLNFSLTDDLMIDTFEASGRTLVNGREAKEMESETKFVNNIMFSIGTSFFFPFGFDYATAP